MGQPLFKGLKCNEALTHVVYMTATAEGAPFGVTVDM